LFKAKKLLIFFNNNLHDYCKFHNITDEEEKEYLLEMFNFIDYVNEKKGKKEK